jgi:hypothetical protein
MKTITEAVATLIEKFPNIEGIKDGKEWDCAEAIHLGNAAEGGTIDGMPAADMNMPTVFEDGGYEFGVHEKLAEALDDLGYFPEFYDPGTLLAWKQ